VSPGAPEVAVVCPTFRRSSYVRRLVAALEAQDLEPDRWEVIVVDNASHDDTGDVLAELVAASRLPMRALAIEVNHGPAAARNLGWRSSTAPLVAFVDDDCVPAPDWIRNLLEAGRLDPGAGVIQGHTEPGEGPMGDWTIVRTVREPSPFFEACNILYRRAALEATGGFDEDIGWYGEDTAAGWAVVEAGWDRGFAKDALVVHDLQDRGLQWWIRNAYLEGNLVAVAARFPGFERDGFWRPWAFHRHDPKTVLAVVATLGVVAAVRRPWLAGLAVLAVPWFKERNPGFDHHRFVPLVAERAVVDTVSVAGQLVGGLKVRRLVI
jgi:GT2 family glycosyltransferase